MARKKKRSAALSGDANTGCGGGRQFHRAGLTKTVVSIPFGAPGDIADVKIDRKRSYAEGHIERSDTTLSNTSRGKMRTLHSMRGCRWQHLPYEFQLKMQAKAG